MTAIILIQIKGVLGVLLSTILCSLLISTWVEAFVLYRHVFFENLFDFFRRYVIYFCILVIDAMIVVSVISLITLTGVLGFLLKLFATVVVSGIMILVSTCWMKEFGEWKTIGLALLRKAFFSTPKADSNP